MKSGVVAFTFAATLAAPVFGEVYAIDPTHTFPTFEILHGGFSLQRGSFGGASGKVTLDLAAKQGTIDVTIDATTVDTRNAARDVHLKGDGFFDVAKYPTITFKSSNLRFDGENLIGADGDLAMHGVTKPVKLAVTRFRCGQSPFNRAKQMCGAEVTTMIQRSEWGIKTGIPNLGDDVRIAIPIEAIKE